MKASLIIVIRHGETEWNLDGRWQGHDDSPLTKNGHRQARATGEALKSFKTAALYSSDLGRAIQTAEYIAQTTGHEIIRDNRLRERKLGIFQGLTTQQMQATYPGEFEDFMIGDPDYRVPQGESIRDRLDRSINCFNQLAVSHSGQTIIVVTHGGVLDGLFRSVVGIPLSTTRNYKIWNCSLNQFSFHNNTRRLDTFGEIGHLRALQTLDDL